MHPALFSWREELPSVVVRGLAVVCALAILSIFSSWLYQAPALKAVARPQPTPDWVEVERPYPAFALTIPEATDVASSYAIRRHASGNGRKDIITLGAGDSAAPFLQIEVYRPDQETAGFGNIHAEIVARAAPLAPADIVVEPEPLDSKFGPLTVAQFVTGKATPRACVAFEHVWQEPRLQIFGWFCQGGEFVSRSMLACALDRFSLLSAGNEPKVTALFAQAELRRSFCGQRSPLLAPTPKHRALWQAVAANTEPKLKR